MAIRIRKVKDDIATGGFSYIALCAVTYKAKKGDVYLDDSVDKALRVKFLEDYKEEGLISRR